MRAVLVESFGHSPTVRDGARPVPAAHQVLVRIEASGLCHTDIQAARGDWPSQPSLPFIPGPAGVGIVTAVGSDVADVHLGEYAVAGARSIVAMPAGVDPIDAAPLTCAGVATYTAAKVEPGHTIMNLGGTDAVIGSLAGTREDLREVFALHAIGRTEIVTQSRRLDDVATSTTVTAGV